MCFGLIFAADEGTKYIKEALLERSSILNPTKKDVMSVVEANPLTEPVPPPMPPKTSAPPMRMVHHFPQTSCSDNKRLAHLYMVVEDSNACYAKYRAVRCFLYDHVRLNQQYVTKTAAKTTLHRLKSINHDLGKACTLYRRCRPSKTRKHVNQYSSRAS